MTPEEIVRHYVDLQILCFVGGVILGMFVGGKLILEAFVHANAGWSRFWLKLFGIM